MHDTISSIESDVRLVGKHTSEKDTLMLAFSHKIRLKCFQEMNCDETSSLSTPAFCLTDNVMNLVLENTVLHGNCHLINLILFFFFFCNKSDP